MNLVPAVLAVVLLGSAAVAMSARNLIHCALWLVAAWSGLAAFYLWAGAEFLAFAQVLIYIGAISMVVLFAVLLTRRRLEPDEQAPAPGRGRAVAAVVVSALVAGVLGRAVVGAPFGPATAVAPGLTVRRLGGELMNAHAGALLVAGVLLTVALIGAVVIASPDSGAGGGEPR